MDKNIKIYVAGHRGMVGSAIVRLLKNNGYENILTRTHSQLDLTSQKAVSDFFFAERPQQVYLAAAKVGGIHANNTFPAEFIYENLMIEANVIHHAFLSGVKKLLFLGSSCIYPKFATQPITEEALLTGQLEATNEPYAIAKISGIKLCESYNRQYGQSHEISYRSVMPTNLFGPGDNYHPKNSHVIPGLLRRFHDAKVSGVEEVKIWGTGSPKREFLFVDDMASASNFVMNLDNNIYNQSTTLMHSHLNVGCGQDITIMSLAQMIAEVVGYLGRIVFDINMPDGTPRKLMDSTKINRLGWESKVTLKEGLRVTYSDYINNISHYNQPSDH